MPIQEESSTTIDDYDRSIVDASVLSNQVCTDKLQVDSSKKDPGYKRSFILSDEPLIEIENDNLSLNEIALPNWNVPEHLSSTWDNINSFLDHLISIASPSLSPVRAAHFKWYA